MHLLTTATSTDEADRGSAIAVLPVGSFEQHGDHLPLITDTVVACIFAERIAATYGLMLLPPVTISCSHEHEGFTGTVSISSRTLFDMVNDIRASLFRSGVQQLVLISGHGGNHVLSNVVLEANVAGSPNRRMAMFPDKEDMIEAREHSRMVSSIHDDMHGGEWETSILLHAYPELVRPTFKGADHDASDRRHFLMTGMRGYTDSGIIGTPSAATAEKGARALDSLVASFSKVLELLRV